MTDIAWEKPPDKEALKSLNQAERLKFLIGGVLILAAVVYLIISATTSGAQYFISIEELVNNPEYVGQTVRVSGAVIGDSIAYDSENLIMDFTVVHFPQETDNLAKALHDSVNDPNAARVAVHIENEVMPDLLQHEAQAILTGTLGEDGVFYATELLLKCPSRYEEAVPEQSENQEV